MKILLALMLTFSIFTDFSSAAAEVDSSLNCENIITCVDIDFHEDSSNGQKSADDKHCHCHTGHSHTALVSSEIIGVNAPINKIFVKFPQTLLGNIHNYFSEINRPPIA